MPWVRKKELAALKAATPSPEKYGGSTRDLTDQINQLVRASGGLDIGADGKALPVPEQWRRALFGPDYPLRYEPLDKPREDSGMPEPRIWQYPVAYNLQIPGQYHTDWETLRRAADTPVYRACIELRKTELSTMDWQVQPSATTVERMARSSRTDSNDVAQQLRQKYESEISRVSDFLGCPDRRNGVEFADWIALVMEEQLVWDAIAIYPRRTFGGQVKDLMVLDGSTIKPLLDETGGRPMPPSPAYQQLLYAFPRGEFTADMVELDGKPMVAAGMSSSQLIYRRRVRRNWTPYGYSPTEQALLSGLMWSKRFEWMLSEYTEGTMPAQFFKNTGVDEEWTAAQLLDWERSINDRYSGKTKERYRFGLLPPGIEPQLPTQLNERYKADYDLYLLKLVCMHYGVTITELGFPETGGLGSTGFHEGQEDIQFRKGRLPDIRWMQNFITYICRTQLDMPAELEFCFLGLEEEDEAAVDQVAERQLATGRRTLNEDRQRLGLPAFSFAEADMPMLQTQRGVVFFEGASKVVEPGILVEPASEQVDSETGQVKDQGSSPAAATGKPGNKTRAVRSVAPKATASKSEMLMAQEELRAWLRWSSKHQQPSRQFVCEHLTKEVAAELAPNLHDDPRLVFKASGAGPKDSSLSQSSQGPYSLLGQHGSETWRLSPSSPQP